MLPLSEPVRGLDGKMINEIVMPKGSFIFCNLRACNSNKAIWGEDAYEWKPERWLQPLPREVLDAHVPGIYANLYVCCLPRASDATRCDASVPLPPYRTTFISGGHACM